MLEKEVENTILDYLALIPGERGSFWKCKVQGTFDAKRNRYRMPGGRHKRNGISDIIGFYRGFFVAFEVKSPKNKKGATLEQKDFLDHCQRNGQVGRVVSSLDQVIETIEIIDDLHLKGFKNEQRAALRLTYP